MQFYWKCEECDETNAYPSVKVCETCGTPMTPAAEQHVLRDQKEEIERQAQIKKEEERKCLEEQRARQEAERKRQERKKHEQLEQALKRKEERETKFASVIRKCTRFSIGFMRMAAVLAVVVTIVLFIQNGGIVNISRAFQGISDNIHSEYTAHTFVKSESVKLENPGDENDLQQKNLNADEQRTSRLKNKVTTQVTPAFNCVFSNIGRQSDYLRKTFKPAENISELVNDIDELLSGGVEE